MDRSDRTPAEAGQVFGVKRGLPVAGRRSAPPPSAPVIAFRRSSVPEVVEHGVTGFFVDDEDKDVSAAGRPIQCLRLAQAISYELSKALLPEMARAWVHLARARRIGPVIALSRPK
jgi:glycosyltransferase involved in cell wall biosynthesis